MPTNSLRLLGSITISGNTFIPKKNQLTCLSPMYSDHIRYIYLMLKKFQRFWFSCLRRKSGVSQKFSRPTNLTKVIFFDRDNTLIEDAGYTYKVTEFKIISRNLPYLIKLKQAGWTFFIVTNQSAVARNYCSAKEVMNFNNYLEEQFRNEGIEFSEIVFCPHLRFCYCRKPKPGMLEYLIKEYSLDKDHTFMLGDSPKDIQAAESASIRASILNESTYISVFSTLLESNYDNC